MRRKTGLKRVVTESIERDAELCGAYSEAMIYGLGNRCTNEANEVILPEQALQYWTWKGFH